MALTNLLSSKATADLCSSVRITATGKQFFLFLNECNPSQFINRH